MVCRYDPYQGYLNVAFSGAWLLFTIWWGVNTWVLNYSYTKPLQKLIIFVLLFKTLYSGFYGGSRLLCETSEDEAYWGLATTSTFTLYNTFAYTILALISRGFCILRDSLSRGEVSTVAIIMGFVYLGFSAYLIQPDDLAPILIVIIGSLFFLSVKSNVINIKLLQARFYNLRNANIMLMLPDISQKLYVMKIFLLLSYWFYLNEITKVMLYCIGHTIKIDGNDNFWLVVGAVEQAIVTVSSFGIFILFRSKAGNFIFNPSLIIPYEPHLIAPIITATVPDSDVEPNENPAIALCPQNFSMSNL
jgi:hypothetical protein